MAICLFISQSAAGGQGVAFSRDGGINVLPWVLGEATFVDGQYSCPVIQNVPEGSHLLLTVAEANALPRTGVPDAALMRDNFFLSFGLILSCYLLGKMVGAVLEIIKRG